MLDLIWVGEEEEEGTKDLIRFSEVQRPVSLPSVGLVICTNRAEFRATPPRSQVHDAKLISNTRTNVTGWADQASVTVLSTVLTSACAASRPLRLMLLALYGSPITKGALRCLPEVENRPSLRFQALTIFCE